MLGDGRRRGHKKLRLLSREYYVVALGEFYEAYY
jgi:hypothetical protein